MSDFNAETMTSEERVQYTQSIRQKVVKGDPVPTDEELRNAIQCLRVERRTASTRGATKRTNGAPAMKQMTLDDI